HSPSAGAYSRNAASFSTRTTGSSRRWNTEQGSTDLAVRSTGQIGNYETDQPDASSSPRPPHAQRDAGVRRVAAGVARTLHKNRPLSGGRDEPATVPRGG